MRGGVTLGSYISSRSRSKWGTSRWLILSIILLVGLGLRLMFLGSKSFWFDEAYGLWVVQLGQDLYWKGELDRYAPPLFYLILRFWSRFALSEIWLRLLAVIPGVLSIPLVYLVSKEWLEEETSLFAAMLVAVSPLLVWYSQELRSYSLLSFLFLLMIWATSRFLKKPSFVWCSLVSITLILALYTHYVSIVMIFFQVLLVIAYKPRALVILEWFFGLCVSVIAWVPWLQSSAAENFFRFALTEHYVVSFLKTRLGLSMTDHMLFLILLVLLGVVLVVYSCICQLLSKPVWQCRFKTLVKSKWIFVLVIIVFLVTTVAFVMPRGYSLKRQLSVFWALALILFAFWAGLQRQRKTLVVVMLVLSAIGSIINVVAIPKPQWREVSAYLAKHYVEGDVILLEPVYMTIPFDFYNQGALPREGLSYGVGSIGLETFISQANRVWFVVHQRDNDPIQSNRSYLDQRLELLETVGFYRLQIRLYEEKDNSR